MLCPFWPPHGGPGVQRAAKFARYLPDFGVAPRVVTRAGREAEDRSLVDEVAGVPVREARHLPLQRLGKAAAGGGSASASRFSRLKQARDWMLVPDHAISWAPFAIRAARRWIAEERPDALFSTSPYHSTQLVGLALKKRTGLPWIADFRDPWASDLFTNYPTEAHRRINARMERAVVRHADRVLFVSEGMRRDFAQRHPEEAGKFEVLLNGFDTADFQGEPARPPQGAPWVIRHLGTFYPDRKPDIFFHGLARLLAGRPELEGKFRVELYGGIHKDVEARILTLLAELGLADDVRLLPYVPHSEAVRLMQSSHALLLVPGPGAGTIPGKVFEYLAARRPIVTMAPALSGVDDVFARLGENPLRATEDADAVARVLGTLVDALEAGQDATFIPTAEQLAPFTRRGAAGRLAAIVGELCGSEVAA